MASLSSAGIGSGLDVAGLVQQLLQAERAPREARLNRSQQDVQAQISALGTFKGALSGLESALAKLGDGEAFDQRAATVGDEDLFTASAEAGVATTGYDISVEALAASAKLRSGAFADADSDVGTGTLTLSLGGDSFDVDVTAGNGGLNAIRDAINNAADNPGIRASVVNGDAGAYLVLTGTETGAANDITVTATGGDGGLDALVYDPGVTENLTALRTAADARVVIDGITHSDTDNQIEGAISGVTLDLKSAAPGQATALSVTADDEPVVSAVKNWVQSYNATQAAIGKSTRVDPDGDNDGALVGDAMLRGTQQQLRGIVGGTRVGDLGVLADIGISTELDGTLKLDEGQLKQALAADREAVAAAFTAEDGLVTRFDSVVGELLGSGGLIQGRTDSLDRRMDGIEDRRVDLQRRMDRMESRLRAEFTALDTMVAEMQSTGDFLSQQLANLA